MLLSENLSNIKCVNIAEIKIGDSLVNLGPVLEIELRTGHYNLIIRRMDQKQVVGFEKDMMVAIL